MLKFVKIVELIKIEPAKIEAKIKKKITFSFQLLNVLLQNLGLNQLVAWKNSNGRYVIFFAVKLNVFKNDLFFLHLMYLPYYFVCVGTEHRFCNLLLPPVKGNLTEKTNYVKSKF